MNESDRNIIERNLLIWKLDEYRIRHIFLTHSHFDHAGNAAYYSVSQDAYIYIGNCDADAIEQSQSGTISYCYNVPFPACINVNRLFDQNIVSIDGVSIRCCSVPGHTPGSMVFGFEWAGKMIWVTGDFLQTGTDSYTPVLGIRVDERYCYEDYHISLKK